MCTEDCRPSEFFSMGKIAFCKLPNPQKNRDSTRVSESYLRVTITIVFLTSNCNKFTTQ